MDLVNLLKEFYKIKKEIKKALKIKGVEAGNDMTKYADYIRSLKVYKDNQVL